MAALSDIAPPTQQWESVLPLLIRLSGIKLADYQSAESTSNVSASAAESAGAEAGDHAGRVKGPLSAEDAADIDSMCRLLWAAAIKNRCEGLENAIVSACDDDCM
jgi:hypothetical protein